MKRVCVLMSTYNGEKYLREQINCILNQKNVEVNLIVRDDGSTDETINILKSFGNKLKYYLGKNIGPAQSFMDLLYNAPKSDYYAFSDQDDFWKKIKLENAIKKISKYEQKETLYISNVEVVDKNLNFLYKGPDSINYSLATSFIESPALGCTMVMNDLMRNCIIKKDVKNMEIALHDSWIYRVAIVTNANIIYDKNAYIKYRQHENNVIGTKKKNDLKGNINGLLKMRKKNKISVAKNLLKLYENEMNTENKNILYKISNLNNMRLYDKIRIIYDKRFRSNSLKANMRFYYDILKNRL